MSDKSDADRQSEMVALVRIIGGLGIVMGVVFLAGALWGNPRNYVALLGTIATTACGLYMVVRPHRIAKRRLSASREIRTPARA
jgi:hypothetical protein